MSKTSRKASVAPRRAARGLGDETSCRSLRRAGGRDPGNEADLRARRLRDARRGPRPRELVHRLHRRQNDFCVPGGLRPARQGPLADDRMCPPAASSRGARELGVPIVHLQQTTLPDGKSDSPAALTEDPCGKSRYTLDGHLGLAFVDGCGFRLGEVVVRKHRSSGFVHTNLGRSFAPRREDRGHGGDDHARLRGVPPRAGGAQRLLRGRGPRRRRDDELSSARASCSCSAVRHELIPAERILALSAGAPARDGVGPVDRRRGDDPPAGSAGIAGAVQDLPRPCGEHGSGRRLGMLPASSPSRAQVASALRRVRALRSATCSAS